MASKYKSASIADLRQSVKTGFRDFNWLGEDPDLKPLHNEAEFKLILEKKEAIEVEENKQG